MSLPVYVPDGHIILHRVGEWLHDKMNQRGFKNIEIYFCIIIRVSVCACLRYALQINTFKYFVSM